MREWDNNKPKILEKVEDIKSKVNVGGLYFLSFLLRVM